MGIRADIEQQNREFTAFIAEDPTKYYKYFDWLEALRQSGIVNMFGASPYLMKAWSLPERKADAITVYWMKHYSELLAERGWKRD